jgi:hypothetical protein
VNDLLKYTAAQIGLAPSPLAAAMQRSQKPIHPTRLPGFSIGLNWIVSPSTGIVWHNGAVYGGMAFVGFDPVAQKGAVILIDTGATNVPTTEGFDPLTSTGLLLVHWLQGTAPPSLASILPPAVTLSAAQLAPFAGTYDLTGGGSVSIALQGTQLVANDAALWPRPIKLYPVAADTFVCREVPARVAFHAGGASIVLGAQTVAATKR